MALRTGGLPGLQKLINSKNIGTIELSTGIQVSGDFSKLIEHDGQPIYFQTTGKTALSSREKELVGHGIEKHPEGFGSPVGKLKGINLAIEDMSPRDLRAYAIYEGENISFEFEGGIVVKGEIITGSRNLQGKIILISLKNCTVTHKDEVLFQPGWGIYDMAIGKEIISAFAGPADPLSFDLITHTTSSTTIKSKKTPEKEELESLYQSVKNIRNGENTKFSIQAAFEIAKRHHPKDWLLSVEIYELVLEKDSKFASEVKEHLQKVKENRPDIAHLVDGGIEMAESNLVSH
jgi:phenylalanine-4-hydroxylase